MKTVFIKKIKKLLLILLKQQPVQYWAGSNFYHLKNSK